MRVLEVTHLNVQFQIMSRLQAMLRREASPLIEAVADVNLSIEKGETYALVGESGSGKSTTASAINRLVESSHESSVAFMGDEVLRMSQTAFKAYRRNISMMFQDPIGSLSPRMTVRGLLCEPFRVHGIDNRDLEAECQRLLELVGLSKEFADRYPHELSGGQARRIGVARAIALDPKFIIADEPTAGLDVSVQGEILNLLHDLQDRLGLTLLVITHNLHVVRHIADRVAIMYLGRIVEDGPTQDVFDAPKHPYTQALLSAAPTPDPDAVHDRIELTGEAPSLKNRPTGCEFRTRCAHARDLCSTAFPPEVGTTRAHRYSCYFPLE